MKFNLQAKIVIGVVSLLTFVCLVIGISTVINGRQYLSAAITEKAKSDTQTSLEIIELLYPGAWTDRDGVLYKGNVKINNNFQLVDKIASLTGNTVTVFKDDIRVATTLTQDGERAVDTKVSARVADAVLKRGQIFSGEADVLGVKYHTYYTPIKDANGKVIGMFYEGVSKQFVDEVELGFAVSFVGFVLLSLLLSSLVGWYMVRKIARPISNIAGLAEQIADWNLPMKVKIETSSHDEIGQLTAAFNKMTEKLRLREQALRESEQKYHSLVDNVNIGIYRNSVDAEKGFIQANPALIKMLGYDSVEEFLYTPPTHHYRNPEERKLLMEEVKTAGFVKNREVELCKKNGTTIQCSFTTTAQYDEDGNIKWLDGVVEDITERKCAEEMLRQVNDELESKVEQRTLELTALNKKLGAMYHDLQEANAVLQNEINERKQAEKELEQKNEELAHAYTKLQSAQSQLIQQEKLAGIGQLAAGVAHEINNPLGFVVSNFETLQKYVDKLLTTIDAFRAFHKQVLEEGYPSLQKAAEPLTSLQKQQKLDLILEDLEPIFAETRDGLNRVGSIIKALRLFSRTDRQSKFEEYDLNEGIKNSLTVSRNEIKYIAEVKEVLVDIPTIKAIGGQINQVLLNIIINAAHAIKAKGSDSLGQIAVSTYADGQFVYCTIEDSGTGIPEKIRNDIFNPFVTTKPVGQGTGLGLSISYDIIVNKHHGEISFTTKAGVGTAFTIKLPITQPNYRQFADNY